jgi:hypothetical protein
MSRWIAAGLLFAIAGIAMFIFSTSSTPSAAPVPKTSKAAVVEQGEVYVRPAVVEPTAPAKKIVEDVVETPPGKLDPKSAEFIELIDDIIPRRLYGTVTDRCYNGNAPDHEKIKIGIRARSVSGMFMVTEAHVMKSNISDKQMEECILTAVKGASWPAEEMPDWEDEDELFIRLGSMTKYIEDFE